jgi:hypothetical protein
VDKKVFTFDNSFWSFSRDDDHYADQDDVYDALGEEFLDHNFEGYHTCIFAYVRTSNSIQCENSANAYHRVKLELERVTRWFVCALVQRHREHGKLTSDDL